MRTNLCRIPLELALILIATSWPAIVAVSAQTPQTLPLQTRIPSTTPTPAVDLKNPKLVPPKGKMRGVTNNMRWAAAIRTQDRKAHPHRKTAKPAAQNEVKQ